MEKKLVIQTWKIYKFDQYKRPISIKKMNINKIVVSNKVSFVKNISNISFATKMIKKS